MSGIKKLLSDRPVAYYPSLARAVGGIAPALFLQQIAHWQGGEDRWVYRTQEELEIELAMSPKVQSTCRKHLVDNGYLEEERRAKNRLHYRVVWDNIEAALETIPTGNTRPARPEELITESKYESKGVEANASSGKPSGKPQSVVPVEKYVTDRIYQAMKNNDTRLPNENYGYQLGRAKDMLAKDSPTDTELESLPDAFVRLWNIKGRADAQAALMEMRRQRARDEILANNASARPDERINPQSDEAVAAKDKPRSPAWYTAFYSVGTERVESWIAEGLGHSELMHRCEKGVA